MLKFTVASAAGKTTLAVDSMISSVGRVYTLYTASISVISTAGTA